MWAWGVSRLRDPLFWSDVVQLGKTVLAAVLAWVVAAEVLDLSQPFLAPWAALLVVHATVYRTFSRGLQQVAAAVVAVVLASAIGHIWGTSTWSVAVLMVVCLVVGSVPWFRAETTIVATTGLVVLTTGFSDDAMLLTRLLDTAIGVAVGLLVNVVVWPPLRSRTAIAAMDRLDDGIGELLVDMARTLREGPTDTETVTEWIDRTRDLDEKIDHAWALVRQAQESSRMNPRRGARDVRDPQRWRDLLRRMEQAVAEVRSLARTWGAELDRGEVPDPEFLEPWSRLLGEGGRATCDADAEALHAVRGRLDELVDTLTARGDTTARWPVHGALIVNLRNILDAMDEVAAANPMRPPPVSLRFGHPGRRRVARSRP
ncbi:MAG TPA: aromatic acid exporter family protein [Nocardioides sp.]|nr:aromatic acid exporter family protein [Nocardioides sp.]